VLAWQGYLLRRNKKVVVYLPSANTDEINRLGVIGEVLTEIPPQRTTIIVALADKQIKKVSYEVKGDALNLYLTPEKGTVQGSELSIETEQLETDLLITFGIQGAEDIDVWPTSWIEDCKQRTPIVNIDIDPNNTQYGSINIVDGGYESMSHYMAHMFTTLEWDLSDAEARQLVEGIRLATSSYSKHVDSKMFATVSNLMKIVEDGDTTHNSADG